MRSFLTVMAVVVGVVWLGDARAWGQALSALEQPALEGTDWPTERVEMLDGRQCLGLIESEDESWVNLVQIKRTPGRPMYLVIRPIERRQVAAVVRLDGPQRAQLQRRIEQFVNRAPIEAGRMDAVHLDQIRQDGGRFSHYRGKWFSLDSTVDEPTTRRIIVRVEQVFTAYRQVLPPRSESARIPRLLVFGSTEEYHAYLERRGLKIDSQACFLQDQNLVVAASELARFAAELANVNARHEQLRREMDEMEKHSQQQVQDLARRLQQEVTDKREIARLLTVEKRKAQEPLTKKQKEINRYDRENAQVFDKVTRQMFTRLYHEAFHAYLENGVYPHDRHDVPLWLNEGLAVLFEGGLLESGTLRIDAPDAPALRRLKADLAGDQPLSLAALLAADRSRFAPSRGAGPQSSERYYLYAWGLAYYLTFEKHLLGSAALDQYVDPAAAAKDPVERFERLVGVPLPQFEEQWRRYMTKLR